LIDKIIRWEYGVGIVHSKESVVAEDVALRYYFFCRCAVFALWIFMGTLFILFLAAFQAGLSEENPEMYVGFGLDFTQVHSIVFLMGLSSVLTILICTHHVVFMKKKESFFPHGEELENLMILGASRRMMWLLIGGFCCMFMTQGFAVHLRQFMFGDTVLGDIEFEFVFRVVEPMLAFAVLSYTMFMAFVHVKFFEHEAYHVMEQKTS